MVRQAERESAEDAVQEDASLRQGTEVEADTAQGRLDAIKRDQEVLGAFYQHLLAPVEAHLAGATEVLIIPHKELFEVPWAALFDSQTGQYLIQRCVLRVAPSLRVARTAADALRGINGYSLGPPPRSVNGKMFESQPTYVEKPKYMSAGRLFHSERKYQSDKTHVASTQVGHALVVGNPLPTREALLCGAEEEAEFVAELLSGEGFEVHALMRQAATKAEVQSKIEGAKWAHLACHGNFDHHSKGPHILLADLSLLPGTFFILYSGFPR